MQKTSRGFTLIEMLIAIVIVSIMAAIAIPSYTRYVQRANRSVVRAALVELAAKQDVQNLQTRSFATSFSALKGVSGTTIYIDRANKASSSSTNAIYQIVLTSPTATSFSLVATTLGYQLKDTDCATLTLTSTGVRSASKSNGADNPECWGR